MREGERLYSPSYTPHLEGKLRKLGRKDKALFDIVYSKIGEIVENPKSYKPLGNILHGRRRVHIGHFVLIFSIDEKENKVIFEDFNHHDKIYRN